MKNFVSIITVSTIGLLGLLNHAVAAAAAGGAGDAPTGGPSVTMTVSTATASPPHALFRGDAPGNALYGIARYLDPKSACTLREVNKSLRTQLPSNKIMTNGFVDQIVSGGTLPPILQERLRALTPEDRQVLLRNSLIEKFGTGSIFKISNKSVFSEDLAAVYNNAYVDPIIQEHNQDYYMGTLSEEEAASLGRTVAQYRTLADVLANPADARIPMYLTATQGELRIHLAEANTYFTTHPEVTLVLQAAVGSTTFFFT